MRTQTRAIDLFAGAGGFTVAAEQAGARVLWAANHWELAVHTHEANHRDTAHVCQDLHQADWSRVPAHDLLLASPSCQGHSNARGKDRPQHDASRATAWAVVSAAEYHRPQTCLVENVPEFLRWALFPAWRDAMRALGYHVREHVLDAADFGVPQNRERLYITCNLGEPLELANPKLPHVPASSFLDFAAGSWSVIDKPGRSRATLARIENGRRDFGPRFLAPYYSDGSGLTGRSIDRPIGTITTKARWALIDGPRMRMLTVREQRAAMGFPAGYHLPQQKHLAIHMLGNAVCPPKAAHLITQIMEQTP